MTCGYSGGIYFLLIAETKVMDDENRNVKFILLDRYSVFYHYWSF